MATVTGGEGLDEALKHLRDQISKAALVRVGFLEDATYPDGTPVANVAVLQNFGAPAAGLPARPFFSDMIREQSPEWGEKFAKILTSVDFDAEKALALMGEGIAAQLRAAIIATTGPALSMVTNLLKQRFPTRDGMTAADVWQAFDDVADGATAPAGKPLVWSGNMLGSVSSEVE